MFPRGLSLSFTLPWLVAPLDGALFRASGWRVLFVLFLLNFLSFSLFFASCLEWKSSSLRAPEARAILPAPLRFFASCLPLVLQYVLGYLPLK